MILYFFLFLAICATIIRFKMSTSVEKVYTVQTTQTSQLPNSNVALNRNISKIQPLVTIQKLMTWLSIFPAGDSTAPEQKWAYLLNTLIVSIILLICLTSSWAYILKFYSTDFNGAAFAFMVTIATFGFVYMLIVVILMRHQIVNIFTNLSIIYKTRKLNVNN